MGVEREPWPGPPGCECDLSLPASERCTKGGWIRCNGALAAQSAQYEKRRAQRQGRGITPQQAREAMGLSGPAGLTEPWREDEFETIQTSAVVAPATPPDQADATKGARGPEGATLDDWRARALAAEALLNAPEIVDFAKAVQLEAAHQRARWGSDHDAGKTDADWFWLLGYLGGKALRADDGIEKQLHRIITVAAAACNWHAAKLGLTNMRPGIETPDGEETSKAEARGDVSQEARSPMTAVRECGDAEQAGDATAARSASPLHASSEEGPGEPGETGQSQTSAGESPGPDELCDIDDLPDCLVGGVHQAHCRHAGKPVTKGGNP